MIFISKITILTKNTPDGYCGQIATNSILGKILENPLYNRTYFHFANNNLLPRIQYGFTHRTSAVKALSQLKSSVQKAINDRRKVIGMSVDIRNEFGSIRANIVERNFKNANLLENIRIIIRDLLQNKTITYQTSKKNISVMLRQGASQRSLLSPFLWNLVTSELLRHKLPFWENIQAFADDLTILIERKTRQ